MTSRTIRVAFACSVVIALTLAGGSATASAVTAPVLDNKLFFGANDATSGRELWKTDATAAGTKRVKDIFPGAASGNPFGC